MDYDSIQFLHAEMASMPKEVKFFVKTDTTDSDVNGTHFIKEEGVAEDLTNTKRKTNSKRKIDFTKIENLAESDKKNEMIGE